MTDIVEYLDGAADNRRWQRFSARPDDIIVSTPPKAGTTLTQMLCALLIFDGPEFPDSLEQISPWFDQITHHDDEALAMVDAFTHRRIIKTHTPLDGIPRFDGVTYLTVHRDPRDVFVSWIHHAANIDGERFFAAVEHAGYTERLLANRQVQPDSWDDRFRLWLGLPWEHSVYSLARIARHAIIADQQRTYPNVHVLHYADLKADVVGAMTTIAGAIGVMPNEVDTLAGYAGIDAMRANAGQFAPTTKGQLSDPTNFFRSGKGGEWRTLVSAPLLEMYDNVAGGLLPSDLRTWLER